MNILRKLTKLDLKLNKKRTIGTLIGIILATALIIVVGGMFEVFRNTLVQESIKSNGYYHIQILNIDKKEIEKFNADKTFSRVNTIGYIGSTYHEFTEEMYDSIVVSMNEETFKFLRYEIAEGTFPKNSNEILINVSYKNMNDIKIGDTIKVVNDLEMDGYDINDPNFSLKEYKVVGITTDYNMNITTNEDTGHYMAYLTLKNPKNHVKDISKLLGVDNYKKSTKDSKYMHDINSELLRWEVLSFSDTTTNLLLGIVGIVIVIILFTSVFSIRNSFAISTNEKIRLYGMLSSTGATKKQIRKMVLFEGLCLGIIGITGGIILGVFVVWFLTWIINYLAINANIVDEKMFYYKFSWTYIIIGIIVSIIMIYLSTISSSIKASHVSPIQNIRNSDNIKAKKLKVPFFIRKIFKTGGVLAYKNLKRSKKKYRVTVISLTISIFVFIIASSLLEYGLKEVKNEFHGIDYDVTVSFYENDNIKIKDFTNLANYHIRYRNYDNGFYQLVSTDNILKKTIRHNNCFYSEDENCDILDTVESEDFYFDDESFREICKKIKVNYEYVKDKVILLDQIKENKKFTRVTNYKKEDIITLINTNTNDSISYEIGAITNYTPWGIEENYPPVRIIINEKYAKNRDKLFVSTIYYKTKNSTKLVEDINKLNYENIEVENVSEIAKQIHTIILIFSIFIYGFIIVVTLIGVTSVFNTINSNMELRKREFATLKSIGMTKHEFNNMILLESIFYSLKSLFFGITLGILGSYLVYNVFKGTMDFGYLLPINSIIISIIFIIALVYTIMKYSLSKTNKQNIIETIRKENI